MAGRILPGRVLEVTIWDWPEGPEPRIVADLPGGVWEIPAQMFAEAGFEEYEQGMKFQAFTKTPEGRVPRTIEYILPQVEEVPS